MKMKFGTKKIELFNLMLGFSIDIIQLFNIKSINAMALFGIGILLILSAIVSFGIRKFNEYDTLVLYSSDADFVALTRYLRKQGKKVILIKGGNITSKLRENVDLIVNAQKIKRYITRVVKKQKPGI